MNKLGNFRIQTRVFCMICFVAPLAGPHTTTKSTDLAGFPIPKDTVILTNYYSVHLDEKQWKDPLRFDPERFLTSEGTLATKTPAQFMPFGIGELLLHFMHINLCTPRDTMFMHVHSYNCIQGS